MAMKRSKTLESVDRRAKDLPNHEWVWEYFATFSGKERRITKKQYETYRRILDDAKSYITRRGQKHKKGAGEVPGAGHCWPMKSIALAVHPDQVGDANARNKRHGVNVSYDKAGTAIIPDEGAYKRLRKLEGVRFNNSYN